MIDRNEFQKIAKHFRAGKLSLSDFTDAVLPIGGTVDDVAAFDEQSIDLRLPVRPANSHKGDFGRILLIGGSVEMPGAIALSAMAALRTGAGLAAIMTPKEAWRVVAGFCPCVMTAPVESAFGLMVSAGLEKLLKKCEWADVVAIGPGMGRSKGCQEIVARLYAQVTCPMIVDADALNNLAEANVGLSKHQGPRVLTPHEGEFLRLTHGQTEMSGNSRSELEQQALRLARENNLVVVLKGPRTFVTDGERKYQNRSGNEGMATAGSGDVLTGTIASMIGQKIEVFEAAEVGCYLHGLAGDIFAESQANASALMATDLLEFLPKAMAELGRGN